MKSFTERMVSLRDLQIQIVRSDSELLGLMIREMYRLIMVTVYSSTTLSDLTREDFVSIHQ